jgi:hypothetical protein
MAMSDCEKCWETPCICGHDYKSWTIKRLEEFSAMIEEVILQKLDAAAEQAVKAKYPEAHTEKDENGIFDVWVLVDKDSDGYDTLGFGNSAGEAWRHAEQNL